MVNVTPTFLALPSRAGKPRRHGITHVLDKGMPVAEVEAILEVCGPYVDVWKFGWGTAYLDPGLQPKLAVLERFGVLACTGGTLLEVAWQQRAVEPYLDWAAEVGFPCVEVSCGVASMTSAERRDLIALAAARFVVLGEVGVKDERAAVVAADWATDAEEDLAAGARWVITEGRESGTVGLFDSQGRVREGVAAAVVDAIGIDNTVFEAPRKEQQAWLINRFGSDVSLANIPPGDVLGLEALRLGLRADTFALTAALAAGATPR
jgi:phosphosulfolactate synthase